MQQLVVWRVASVVGRRAAVVSAFVEQRVPAVAAREQRSSVERVFVQGPRAAILSGATRVFTRGASVVEERPAVERGSAVVRERACVGAPPVVGRVAASHHQEGSAAQQEQQRHQAEREGGRVTTEHTPRVEEARLAAQRTMRCMHSESGLAELLDERLHLSAIVRPWS